MDYAFCSGSKPGKNICEKRDMCKRHVLSLEPKNHSYHQSWMEATFIQKLDGVSCEFYERADEWKK